MKSYKLSWMKALVIFSLLGASGASAQVPNEERCAWDKIYTNAEANERINWALHCGYITPQQALSYRYYYDVVSCTIQLKPVYSYPTFGWLYPDIRYTVVWAAPTDAWATCAIPFQYNNYAHAVAECPVSEDIPPPDPCIIDDGTDIRFCPLP